MKYGFGILVLITMMIICGCAANRQTTAPSTLSNVGVRTSFSPAAQFPRGSHYAFVQFASASDRSEEEARIEQRLRTSLSNELKSKGYKPGEYSDIDFFVVYTLGLQHEIEVLIGKSKVQGNEWITALVAPNDYVSGALLVQMIDAKKMEPVWLGVFNADVALVSISERDKQERADFAVRELLKQFPPK